MNDSIRSPDDGKPPRGGMVPRHRRRHPRRHRRPDAGGGTSHPDTSSVADALADRVKVVEEAILELAERQTVDAKTTRAEVDRQAMVTDSHARDRTRRAGRAPGRYVISRTLLVKWQEFDHALVLDANALDRKNLYVALTRRGSHSRFDESDRTWHIACT